MNFSGKYRIIKSNCHLRGDPQIGSRIVIAKVNGGGCESKCKVGECGKERIWKGGWR